MSAIGCFFLRFPRVLVALSTGAIMFLILAQGLSVPAQAALSASESSQTNRLQVLENYGRLPLTIIPNAGQMDPRVKFYARVQGQTVYFTPTEVVFDVPAAKGTYREGAEGRRLKLSQKPGAITAGRSKLKTPGHRPSVVRLVMEGLRPGVEITPLEGQVGTVNIFQGNDPTKWRTDIPTYRAVLYREAYPGIDLKFYGAGRQLEYDVIVKPGADPGQVRFRYAGVKGLTVSPAGDLAVRLPDGAEFIQKKPVVYQQINGERRLRKGAYRVARAGDRWVFSVAVSDYDPHYALIIDPLIIYSTYLGGSNEEIGYGIAVDSKGCAYVTGYTYSTDFPTSNAYQVENLGERDVFVTKLTAEGNALVYSTYLGGSTTDCGNGIVLDASGCAYVTGYTYSTDFPTVNAYQASKKGGEDAFVTKLNDKGNMLVYSTYLGGNSLDMGGGIAVDASGCAYVTGVTLSADFPTVNAYQGDQGGNDAFVTKLSAEGDALVYSTYLGGGNMDQGNGIAVDGTGCAYVTGYTYSDDFPTLHAYQAGKGGDRDAFVTKLKAEGDALVYSTYLGGDKQDSGDGIAVDASRCAYVTGETWSNNFPTSNAYQGGLKGEGDAFVTKLHAVGNALAYSTYLGGSSGDWGNGIAVDGKNCAYVTGCTYSDDFPTLHAFQGDQGATDAFVTKLSAAGNALVYSTYLGGIREESGIGIAVDGRGYAYVAGFTRSDDFPTVHAYQGDQEATDAFVTKIGLPFVFIPHMLLLQDSPNPTPVPD